LKKDRLGYESFSETFEEQNELLKGLMGYGGKCFFIIIILILLNNLFGKVQFQDNMILEDTEGHKRKACYLGFDSIARGVPDERYVTSGLRKTIEKVGFDLKLDAHLYTSVISEKKCHIVSENKHGLVAHIVVLAKSKNKFSLVYKVGDVIELQTDQDLKEAL